MKINVSAEYRTSDPLVSSRTPRPLDYRDLCFKLFQFSEMTGNARGVSKHVAIQ